METLSACGATEITANEMMRYFHGGLGVGNHQGRHEMAPNGLFAPPIAPNTC